MPVRFTHSKEVWNPKDEYRCTISWGGDHPERPDITGPVRDTPAEALEVVRAGADLRIGHTYSMEHRTVSSWCFW